MTRDTLPTAQPEVSPIGRSMVVIPCLNEAAHIGRLTASLLPAAERLDMIIVIVDGGSSDGTDRIVQDIVAGEPRVKYLHNPKRLQSAAVNLAVEVYGDNFENLIRIDAHADYPDDYCDRVIEEAIATGADSVTTTVATSGTGTFQKATAAAQNSRLGNGNSPHRQGAPGRWTDHGHHTLMRIAAYREVGGYDETFSANEDAELDHRLRAAGYRIWMTDKTYMIYYPRSSVRTLFKQYVGYGRGRARNLLKHGTRPKVRQLVPLMVLPAAAGAGLAILNVAALAPAGVWVAACLGYGVWMGLGHRNPYGPLAGFSAMVMHLGWSSGFWLQLFDHGRRGVFAR